MKITKLYLKTRIMLPAGRKQKMRQLPRYLVYMFFGYFRLDFLPYMGWRSYLIATSWVDPNLDDEPPDGGIPQAAPGMVPLFVASPTGNFVILWASWPDMSVSK